MDSRKYSPAAGRMKKIWFLPVLSLAVFMTAVNTFSFEISEMMYGAGLCSINPVPVAISSVAPPYVIAIDPGHGGMDTGAQAIVEEYEVIDKTAAFLYEMLARNPDYIPVYTRTDSDPSSRDRARTANARGAALLISLHANSDSSPSSKGFECFPSPPGRTHHAESLRFAQLITRGMSRAGHTLRGGEEKTGIKYAYYSGKSKRIVDSTDTKIRSLPSFGILEKTDCPAVLVEQCFITNQKDTETWATEAGCRCAAAVYYRAITEFFS